MLNFAGHIVIRAPRKPDAYQRFERKFNTLVREQAIVGAAYNRDFFSVSPLKHAQDQPFLSLAKKHRLKTHYEPAVLAHENHYLNWVITSAQELKKAMTAWGLPW